MAAGRPGEVPVRVHSVPQQLAADRLGALHQLRWDRHVVLRAQPAIAVAAEQHFAWDIGAVGARRVPEAPVVEECVDCFDATFRPEFQLLWHSSRVRWVFFAR